MRLVPEGLRTATLVVTSSLRRWTAVASLAKIRPRFAKARLAEKAPADRMKSRRFMF
jgi:hypothetical protein